MRYFIILITSIWFLVGCEDLLDMEPKNSLTYGNSMTEKELEASVRGAQAIIRTYMMMHYNNGSNYVNGSYADGVEYYPFFETESGPASNSGWRLGTTL